MIGLSILAVGCGKRGSPVAPRPRGPQPAARVEGRQLGDSVVVSFTVPDAQSAATDEAPVRAELMRLVYETHVETGFDPGAFRRRGQLVAALERDPFRQGERVRLEDRVLPTFEDAGPTLRYGLRLFDREGRSSAIAVAADLQQMRSLPPPNRLRADLVPEGVRLSWISDAGTATHGHAVYRADGDGEIPESPLNATPLTSGEFLDATVTRNATYRYEVRPILAAGLPRREGSGTQVTVVSVDRFPPLPPEAVVAVQERAAVRLFWRPNAENDVAGYRIWRRSADEEWIDRSGIVERPLWLDTDVVPAARFVYRITAIDAASPANESGPSKEVEIEIAEEPEPIEGSR